VQTAAVSTAASLVIIFAIIGLLLICCFGFGTLLVCSYQISKASKEISAVQKKHAEMKEMKRQGQVNASESQMSVDHQFDMPADVDMDIFTSKKRALKVN